MDILTAYSSVATAMGAMAAIMFVQLIGGDIIGIRAKHTPGSPVEADHSNLHFRASRTVANTNESIAIFILAVIFGVFQGADPKLMGYAAWAYVSARAAYALCYYLDIRALRSIVFALAVLSLLALLILGLRA